MTGGTSINGLKYFVEGHLVGGFVYLFSGLRYFPTYVKLVFCFCFFWGGHFGGDLPHELSYVQSQMKVLVGFFTINGIILVVTGILGGR